MPRTAGRQTTVNVSERIAAFIVRVTKQYDASTLAAFRTAEHDTINLPQSEMKNQTSSRREVIRHIKRLALLTADMPADTIVGTLRSVPTLVGMIDGSGIKTTARAQSTSTSTTAAAVTTQRDERAELLAALAAFDGSMTVADLIASLQAKIAAEQNAQRANVVNAAAALSALPFVA